MQRLSLCEDGSVYSYGNGTYIEHVDQINNTHKKILEDTNTIKYKNKIYYLLMDFTQLKYNFYLCTTSDNKLIFGLVLSDYGDIVYEVKSLESLNEVIKSDRLRNSLLTPNPNPVEALTIFLKSMGEI